MGQHTRYMHLCDIISAYSGQALSPLELPASPDGAPAQQRYDYADGMLETIRFVSRNDEINPSEPGFKEARISLLKQFPFIKDIACPYIDDSMSDAQCRAIVKEWQTSVCKEHDTWHEVCTQEYFASLNPQASETPIYQLFAENQPEKQPEESNIIRLKTPAELIQPRAICYN